MEEKQGKAYLQQLAHKWKNRTLTTEEQNYLDHWDNSHNDELLNLPDHSGGPETVKARMFAKLTAAIRKNQTLKSPKLISIKWLSAAAIAFIALGVYLYQSYYTIHQSGTDSEHLVAQNDILPGTNKATLTLANGKTINLNDTKTGVVIAHSSLVYSDGTAVNSTESLTASINQILTAKTPRGGQYQVTLPDGTHVWLNAESSIKFPSKFTGNSRKVEISGEVYFEVAKNKELPFIVKTDKQEVEVLGTHFNINSYADEAGIKTTLLEGSVRVSSTGAINKTVLLKPGQQAVLENNQISVKKADMEVDLAWKNGLFIFKDSDLKIVMRQLSRWYDLDVEFKGQVPEGEFNGKVYRNMTLNEVLVLLSFSKVKFRIEGKKMIII